MYIIFLCNNVSKKKFDRLSKIISCLQDRSLIIKYYITHTIADDTF